MTPATAPGAGGIAWSKLPHDPALQAERFELDEGAIVYEPHAPANKIYFIESGQILTYEAGPAHSSRLLEILGPSDWFGEAALARIKTYRSQAIAGAPTALLAIGLEALMETIALRPVVAAELIRQLAERLQRAREDASRMASQDAAARLVDTLLRFGQTTLALQQDDGSVVLRITHRQLAQAVGAARETISLALTQLRQKKYLQTGRNRLIFKPAELQRFISSSRSIPKSE